MDPTSWIHWPYPDCRHSCRRPVPCPSPCRNHWTRNASPCCGSSTPEWRRIRWRAGRQSGCRIYRPHCSAIVRYAMSHRPCGCCIPPFRTTICSSTWSARRFPLASARPDWWGPCWMGSGNGNENGGALLSMWVNFHLWLKTPQFLARKRHQFLTPRCQTDSVTTH